MSQGPGSQLVLVVAPSPGALAFAEGVAQLAGHRVAGPDRTGHDSGQEPPGGPLAGLEAAAAELAAALDLAPGCPPALDRDWTTRPDLAGVTETLRAALHGALEAEGTIAWVDSWGWLTAPLWARLGAPVAAIIAWSAPGAGALEQARRDGTDVTGGLAWWETALRRGAANVAGLPALCCPVPSPDVEVPAGSAPPGEAHHALTRWLEGVAGLHDSLRLPGPLPFPSGWAEPLLAARRQARNAAAAAAAAASGAAGLHADLADTVAALHWVLDRPASDAHEPTPATPGHRSGDGDGEGAGPGPRLDTKRWEEWEQRRAPRMPAAGAGVDVMVVAAGRSRDGALAATVRSVLAQTWPEWTVTLCTVEGDPDARDASAAIRRVVDATADRRVRPSPAPPPPENPARESRVPENRAPENRAPERPAPRPGPAGGGEVGGIAAALAAATAPWVTVVDAGDTLPAGVLAELLAMTAEDEALDLIYSDETAVAPGGVEQRRRKPGWSPVLLGTSAYIGRLWLMRRRVLDDAGGVALAPAWEYDLMLRTAEHARHVAHLPLVGYRRRHGGDVAAPAAPAPLPDEAWTPAATAGAATARQAAAARRGDTVSVMAGPSPASFRIGRPLRREPTLRAVIPVTTDAARLRAAADGLADVGGVPGAAVTFVRAGVDPSDPETDAVVARLVQRPGWRLVEHPGGSWTSARQDALDEGCDLTLLVDAELDLTAGGWLRTLVDELLEPGVGAVGATLLSPAGDVTAQGLDLGPGPGPLVAGRGGGPDRPEGWRSVSADCLAVSGCLLTWTALLSTFGLDPAVGDRWTEPDFCLRLRAAGWGVAASAHARLRWTRPTPPPGQAVRPPEPIARRWAALFAPPAGADPYAVPPGR